PSGRGYRFTHAKFREVVSDAILPELRADLHARIAEHLRRDRSPDPARVARHLVAAGKLTEALPFLLAGGRAALRQGASAEALSLFAAAAEAFAAIGSGETRDHLAVLLELGRLQRTAGRRDAARETFTRTCALARTDSRNRA